jgi:hypothetical protein
LPEVAGIPFLGSRGGPVRFDSINFSFPVNAGTKGEIVEMALMLLHYLPSLNQRVPGSSPGAPTNPIRDLDGVFRGTREAQGG